MAIKDKGSINLGAGRRVSVALPTYDPITPQYVHMPTHSVSIRTSPAMEQASFEAGAARSKAVQQYREAEEITRDAIAKRKESVDRFADFMDNVSTVDIMNHHIKVSNQAHQRLEANYTSGQEIRFDDIDPINFVKSDKTQFTVTGNPAGDNYTNKVVELGNLLTTNLIEGIRNSNPALHSKLEQQLGAFNNTYVNRAFQKEGTLHETYSAVVEQQMESEVFQRIQEGISLETAVTLMQPAYAAIPESNTKQLRIARSKSVLAREVMTRMASVNPALAHEQFVSNKLYRSLLMPRDFKHTEHVIKAAYKSQMQDNQQAAQQRFLTSLCTDDVQGKRLKNIMARISMPRGATDTYGHVELAQDIARNDVPEEYRGVLTEAIDRQHAATAKLLIKQTAMELVAKQVGVYPTANMSESDNTYVRIFGNNTKPNGESMFVDEYQETPRPVLDQQADGSTTQRTDALGPVYHNAMQNEVKNVASVLSDGSKLAGDRLWQFAISKDDSRLLDALLAVSYCDTSGHQGYINGCFKGATHKAEALRAAKTLFEQTSDIGLARARLVNAGSVLPDMTSAAHQEFKKIAPAVLEEITNKIRKESDYVDDDILPALKSGCMKEAAYAKYNIGTLLELARGSVSNMYGKSAVSGDLFSDEVTFKPLEDVLNAPSKFITSALITEMQEVLPKQVNNGQFSYAIRQASEKQGNMIIGTRKNKSTGDSVYGVYAFDHVRTTNLEDEGQVVVKFLPIGDKEKMKSFMKGRRFLTGGKLYLDVGRKNMQTILTEHAVPLTIQARDAIIKAKSKALQVAYAAGQALEAEEQAPEDSGD